VVDDNDWRLQGRTICRGVTLFDRAWRQTRSRVWFGALVMTALSISGCSPCENTLLAEYPSPSGKVKVVVFGRECGATTGFSVQASILSAASEIGSGAGNTFTADSDHGAAPVDKTGRPRLRVRWLSADVVELAHHAKARKFKMEHRVRGIAVHYTVLE
jgi:hypothetical protein